MDNRQQATQPTEAGKPPTSPTPAEAIQYAIDLAAATHNPELHNQAITTYSAISSAYAQIAIAQSLTEIAEELKNINRYGLFTHQA